MIEPVSIALLAHPYSFFLKFFVEASAAALITYGLVWVVMRPKDGRRVPSPFLWHLFGTMTALTCGAIFRTFAMLTFEGRGAYEPAAETGAAAFYTLFVPAVAAAVYLFFRLRHLSPTNHADPDQTNADFVDTSPNGGIPTMAREEMTRVGAADLKLASGPSEEFWSEANAELESTSRRPGLWARVFSESKGNESLAKANYLRHRALELQQQQDAQLEQARRDVEEATRVDAIAPQAAKEHADAAVLKGICPNCNAVVPLGVKRCPKCPAVFGPHSAWALHPVIASMEANGEPIGRVAPVPDAVPPWASTFLLVMAGVVVFGIVTAVVPAYQDYIKRQQATANPYGSQDHPITRDTYLAKVRSLLARVERGETPSVEGLTSSDAPKGLTQWPDADTLALEANQTWWRNKGIDFHIHVLNPTVYDMVAMGLEYSDKGCAQNSEKRRVFVTLAKPLGPGSQAVVNFRPELAVGDASSISNCLEIASAWKASGATAGPAQQSQTNLKPFNGQLDLSEFQKPPSKPAPIDWSKGKIALPETRDAKWSPADIDQSLHRASRRILAEYPYLDTPAGEFALNRIVVERDARIAKGEHPADALLNAARAIASAHQPR